MTLNARRFLSRTAPPAAQRRAQHPGPRSHQRPRGTRRRVLQLLGPKTTRPVNADHLGGRLLDCATPRPSGHVNPSTRPLVTRIIQRGKATPRSFPQPATRPHHRPSTHERAVHVAPCSAARLRQPRSTASSIVQRRGWHSCHCSTPRSCSSDQIVRRHHQRSSLQRRGRRRKKQALNAAQPGGIQAGSSSLGLC